MTDHDTRTGGRSWLIGVLGAVAGIVAAALVVMFTPIGGWLVPTPPDAAPAHEHTAAEQVWTCPMHPRIVEPEPGSCPICGMDLVAVEGGARAEGPRTSEHGVRAADQVWTCPMHPQVIEPEPGSCPICGMDLVPAGNDDPLGVEHGHSMAESGQGAIVRIDPAVVQNMNVTTEQVELRDISRQIRTVGYLEYDQDSMVTVTTKYPGFVEKVYVNYVGQPVDHGQPLFEVYAPELVQTQQELLSAVRYAARLSEAPERTRERAEALIEAARQRLDYWDVTPEQIAAIEASGEPMRTLVVTAPASGLAMQVMHGLEGMRISPGMDVIHIAGMRTLWLTVEVFEDQLPWLGIGSPATVSFTYFPGETFTERVRYIEPEVDETTRTIQLTISVPNPRSRLRVGMYATVVFEPVASRGVVAVPRQAVLRTGERNVVVVALGKGRFAPRDVTLGVEGDDFVQVLDGLAAGESIVTSAQFLIDSESNLRAAIRQMHGH
jgi:RND family efflux transporter MFP subunit